MSEAKAVSYICQVADALRYLHQQHICHLDIKPANILTKANGDAVLADFGLAKQYDEDGGETSTTPVGKSKGYAPPEQYRTGGVKSFSPETDIYALGATLYFLLTGKTPPESVLLNEVSLDVSPLSPNMAQAVQATMQLRRADRATLDAFEELLNKKPEQPKPSKDEDITIVDVEPTPVKPQTKRKENIWNLYPKTVKIIFILITIFNAFGVFCSFIVFFNDELTIIESLPLYISLASCFFLCKGEKYGFWGIQSSICLYILYYIVFPPNESYTIIPLFIFAVLLPTFILIWFSLSYKRNGIKTFSILRQTNRIKWIMLSIIIIAEIISFTIPYYFINKLGIKKENEWSRAVTDIRMAKHEPIVAKCIYEDYSEASNFYKDYFYKDEEKAAYWLNKYNELKAQGK